MTTVYVLTGIADRPQRRPQTPRLRPRPKLELAVELLRGGANTAEDTNADEAMDTDQPLGRLVGSMVLDPDTVSTPKPPYRQAVEQGKALFEAFVGSRVAARE